MAIKFDSTIGLGHVMSFVGFMIAGFAGYTNVQVELTKLNLSVQTLKEDLTEKTAQRYTKQDAQEYERRMNERITTLAGNLNNRIRENAERIRDMEMGARRP